MFCYQVVIEGIEGCSGTGYSKKESQQLASRLTLEKLRKEPQFIDLVFAAKTERTKMEETPVQNVPDTDNADDFIVIKSEIDDDTLRRDSLDDEEDRRGDRKELDGSGDNGNDDTLDDEFDLSGITAREQSREDIIAAAEKAAFEQDNA